MTLEEQNHLSKEIKSLKRKGSFAGETSKKACIEEMVPTTPIQASPTPKFDAATSSLALPDESTLPTSSEWEEVIERKKKKEKNAIAKKLGHYLFAHSKVADLHQVETFQALQEAQVEVEKVQAEVDCLKVASEIQTPEVEHLREAL
ncbi:hypothetical protein COCNU_scaffold002610G000010 [Cocos nucifera]|nr:hypothetical protein [Cocos nucifera]